MESETDSRSALHLHCFLFFFFFLFLNMCTDRTGASFSGTLLTCLRGVQWCYCLLAAKWSKCFVYTRHIPGWFLLNKLCCLPPPIRLLLVMWRKCTYALRASSHSHLVFWVDKCVNIDEYGNMRCAQNDHVIEWTLSPPMAAILAMQEKEEAPFISCLIAQWTDRGMKNANFHDTWSVALANQKSKIFHLLS